MKRCGKILAGLACGMALAVLARADTATPMAPGITNDVLRQKLFLERKMELLKKLREKHPGAELAPTMKGFSQPKSAPPPMNSPAPTTTPNSVAPETDPNNPYSSIVTRNIFGLNPPPPPVANPADANPPPKITLTGITTIFGPAEALFKVAGGNRGGKQWPDESYILKEGEGQDNVAVQHIDVNKGMVTFLNHGESQDVMLVAGTATGGATPSGAGAPSGYQPPGVGPGFHLPANFNNLPPAVQERLRQRLGTVPGQTSSPGTGYNGGYNGGYNSYGSAGTANTGSANYNGLSAEDTTALIAAQHAQLEQEGNPMAAILPPTQFDDQARQEAARSNPNAGERSPSAPPAP